MLKFYWNGIKEDGGKLQKCGYSIHYSMSKLINFPEGTITIYARNYENFSRGIANAFNVENNSECWSDYMENDRIRVEPTHKLYTDVLRAYNQYDSHNAKIEAKREGKRAA